MSVQFSVLQLVSCHVIEDQEIGFRKVGTKVVSPSSDSSWQCYTIITCLKLSMPFQVSLGLWLHLKEILLGLGLTEINIKEVQKQEKKNVGMACQKYANKVRDKVKVKENIRSPIPTSFYTTVYSCTLVWKTCRDEALYICLQFYLIPTLFAYFPFNVFFSCIHSIATQRKFGVSTSTTSKPDHADTESFSNLL